MNQIASKLVTHEKPIILGIDPGSCFTGYGFIQNDYPQLNYLASGSIKVGQYSFLERLEKIFTYLRELIAQYNPQEVAIEQIFFHINPNTALKLGQARGAALAAIGLSKIMITEYSARQVKQSVVGYGAATKQQVQHMVSVLLNLSEKPQVDAADALALAICHAQKYKTPQLYRYFCRKRRKGRD